MSTCDGSGTVVEGHTKTLLSREGTASNYFSLSRSIPTTMSSADTHISSPDDSSCCIFTLAWHMNDLCSARAIRATGTGSEGFSTTIPWETSRRGKRPSLARAR